MSLLRPMLARDKDDAHRAATPLELLFDLCFVVAIAQASYQLHHGMDEGHVTDALLGFVTVFFTIWWAWMNFTWFASAFDNDDVVYRLLTFVQIGGVLILAAGIPNAANNRDFEAATYGYVIMRVALVCLWLRAAIQHPESRPATLRYAGGVASIQVLWLGLLLLPGDLAFAAFPVLAGLELAIPVWAERATQTAWHPGHIAERYGLFTIIVIGEAILGATTAIRSSFTEQGLSWSLIGIGLGGLVIALGTWWAYFAHEAGPALRRSPNSVFRWGYGHFFLFGAIAAAGAGIQSVLAKSLHHSELSNVEASLTLSMPAGFSLLVIGLLHEWTEGTSKRLPRFIVAAVAVVLSAIFADILPLAGIVAIMALVIAGLIAVEIRDGHHEHENHAH